MHHFHTKLPYQKLILRQIKWWLQNGSITKNGVLPVTTLFFWKFYFSLRTSYKELICCTYNPIPVFVLFVSAGVFFDGTFSLWVSLNNVRDVSCFFFSYQFKFDMNSSEQIKNILALKFKIFKSLPQITFSTFYKKGCEPVEQCHIWVQKQISKAIISRAFSCLYFSIWTGVSMWKRIYIHQKDNGTTFLSVTATSALPYYTDACHLRMYVSLPKKVNYYCLSKKPLLKVNWINTKNYC